MITIVTRIIKKKLIKALVNLDSQLIIRFVFIFIIIFLIYNITIFIIIYFFTLITSGIFNQFTFLIIKKMKHLKCINSFSCTNGRSYQKNYTHCTHDVGYELKTYSMNFVLGIFC